ncbi:MAG: peptidylprolyl isomerase [Oscillospiraceae bacterium]|nr:peptidylprolyl isomerase [Oscillospiraceae bacterium]MBQ9046201.1 peptidylprolyl isomerase [Oscillospiraceae bacterium]
MKRYLSIALALALLLGALSGCAGGTEVRSYSEDALNADPGQRVMDAYSPDMVVMKIDGTEVRWDEYAFWLCSTAKDLADEAGVTAIEDWNAVNDAETGETYADMLRNTVLKNEKQFHSLEAKAADYGLELGEEGAAYVEQSLQESLDSFSIPSEEEAGELLHKYYLDTDVLRYQAKIAYLYLLLYQEMFGPEGEKLSEEELNDYVAQNGYMTVKHILFSTVDENNEPIDESALQRKLDRAQRVIERIQEIEDPEERLRQFERYMRDYNEDPGAEQYPGGYCFTAGQMDAAFETASAQLQPYEITPEPVQTEHGYHVILRIPTTGDDVLDYNEDGTPYLLRSDAAQAIYTSLVQAWIADAEVEWSEGFEDLDIQTLFAKEETFWEKADIFHWFH